MTSNPTTGPETSPFQIPLDVSAHFERAASSYEKSGGNFTGSISRHLVSIAQPPLSRSSIVLDNACGPGITCGEIVRSLPKDRLPTEIHATDFSPAMIRELEKKGYAEVQAAVMDASDLKFADGKFSHIFFALAIFALPDPVKGARELVRCLQSGGTAYVVTWAALGWTPPVSRALKSVRPDANEYQGPIDPAWFKAEKLRDVLVSGGFAEEKVEVHQFESKLGVEGWDGTMNFLDMGIMAAIAKANEMTEQETKDFESAVRREIEAERSAGNGIVMPAWIGVARK